MKHLPRILALCAALVLTGGCSSLMPKPVEFGQDKVHKFPEPKPREQEVVKQAALRAAEQSQAIVVEVIHAKSDTNIIQHAQDVADINSAISRHVGPPLEIFPKDKATLELARKLDNATAKLDSRVEEFKQGNDKDAGKKIEGTGILSVPYFIWIGIVGVLGFIGFIVLSVLWGFLKMYALSNPPLALGLNAVQAGGKVAASAVGQLVKGGETFKNWLKTEVPEINDATRAKIEDLFKSAHKENQDQNVQAVVKELTK